MKTEKNKSSKVVLFGTILSISLFILSLIIMYRSIQGNWMWPIALVASLVVGLVTTSLFPRSGGNGGMQFAVGGLFVLMILVVFDMYDEATSTYNGGLESGNGFLLDGVAQVIYLYALPLLYLAYIVLLLVNVRKKLKTL